MHRLFRVDFLELPFDLAGQGDDPPFDLDRDPPGGQPDLPFQNVDGAFGNLVVRTLGIGAQAHLDLLGNRLDPLDPPSRSLGHQFLGIARHRAGERDDAVMGSDADMRGIDAGLEFKLVNDIPLKFQIADHSGPPQVREAVCPRRRVRH